MIRGSLIIVTVMMSLVPMNSFAFEYMPKVEMNLVSEPSV